MRLDDGRVVPNFVRQALRGEPLTVYGDGSHTRSFCYVSDLIDGFCRLLLSDEVMPVNLGNPREMTVLEFAQAVRRASGQQLRDRLYRASGPTAPKTTPVHGNPTSPALVPSSVGSRK